MKKLNITTPENIELEVTTADALSRVTAAMIDMIIQGFLKVIIGCFLAVLLVMLGIDDNLYTGILIGGLLIISMIIDYGYFVVLEIRMHGQTIGKRIMNLRVIRDNGGPVTVKEVAIRNLFRTVLENYGIGMILIFVNKENKRLGDMAAGTIVIVEEKAERPIPLENFVAVGDEIRSYLSPEQYNLLREYFERKKMMTDYEPLRKEMVEYFTDKFTEWGIYENNKAFIESL